MNFSIVCLMSCLLSSSVDYKVLMNRIASKPQEEVELIDVNQVYRVKGVPFKKLEWKDSDWPLLSLTISNCKGPLAYTVFKKIIKTSHLDVNAKTQRGRTPLMFAAAFSGVSDNNLEALKTLLAQKNELNLNLNAQDESGRTALMMAVENSGPLGLGSVAAVQMLLEAGADANLKTRKGQLAWSLGMRQCNQGSSLEAVEMVLASTELSALSLGEVLAPVVRSIQDKRFDDISICTFLSLIRHHLVAQGQAVEQKFFNGWQCSLGASVSPLVRLKLLTLLDLKEDDECVICTDSFQLSTSENQEPPSVLGCGHFFHESCLSQWSSSCSRRFLKAEEVFCPSCKTKQKIPN
ncbi:MAG: ankyrin repeat domain-containing protein [Oligoflexales bacterium]